ncbi:hypothetical protein GCM10009777_10220 [Microbacterium pumilum]|uniref:Lipopolysaccharide biosynthesis protein n=1 Tax=Microbacterium pumilum TaxID=344165 RepID=A0ABN2S1U8_9MICO
MKAASPAEFLSLVPHLLGFRPVRSLVVIPFAGSRSLGAMRFDLPDDEPDAIDRVASTIIGMVCRVAEAESLTTVVYTDARFADAEGMPHRDLSAALETRAHACGMRVVDGLCVAGDGWGSYLDAECPPAGRALAELGDGAAPVGSLPDPAGDQTTGATLPSVDLAERERVARALASLHDAVALLCGPDSNGDDREDVGAAADAGIDVDGAAASAATDVPAAPDDSRRIDPRALAAVCVLDDLPTLFEAALAWDIDALEPYDAASIAWCLARPAMRDIALVQWCGGLAAGDEALDAQLRWEAGEEYPAHLAMHMWGEGAQPDPDRLSAALGLARRVAAGAPRGERAGALATCAWLAWALGRSTHAELYALEACTIEPEHGLAEIVRSFVHAGHLPDWAFQRPPRSKRRS